MQASGSVEIAMWIGLDKHDCCWSVVELVEPNIRMAYVGSWRVLTVQYCMCCDDPWLNDNCEV